jgi:hypothetical protein
MRSDEAILQDAIVGTRAGTEAVPQFLEVLLDIRRMLVIAHGFALPNEDTDE